MTGAEEVLAIPDRAAYRRIFGVETEYGLSWAGGALDPQEAARELFSEVVEWGRSSNVFLTNAGRLYLDVGAHPEYATAECDNLTDLIAQEAAGDRILAGMAARTEARLNEAGRSGKLHLFKNNVDSAGHSFGCHENYLIRRSADIPALHRRLIPFLVVRQLIAGAGHVLASPRGARYVYSQRADHVWESVSSATTRSRPMINTRDEAHADGALYRRLHVIVGDSSMCQATQLVKIGSTDLVLRLIEAGAKLPDIDLASPTHAIRNVSHALPGSALIALSDGREMTGLDILESYLEAVEASISAAGLSTDAVGPSDAAVLDLWRRGVDALRRSDTSSVDRELDWAIKRRLIERYQDRSGASLLDPRVARLELAYHDIGPAGLLPRLEAAGQAVRLVDEAQVRDGIVHAPGSTRAALRGRFVTAALAAKADYSVDWTHLKLTSPQVETVTLLDPFAAVDERVDRLIEALDDPKEASEA
ncbi:MAG: Pup--protein ligase [Bifidobacteriaceae bacterium]|nr:Pup--protein ligase [Bifidobacteriaceae bacterium]